MHKAKTFFSLLKSSAIAFDDDNAFKLSASLSYYTIFALGPLLFIIISLSGFFYGKEAIEGRIYEKLNGLVGNDAALQIQNIIANASEGYDSTTGAIVGLNNVKDGIIVGIRFSFKAIKIYHLYLIRFICLLFM